MKEDKEQLQGLVRPDINKPAAFIIPHWKERVLKGACTECEKEIKVGDFTSDLCKREYSISGMCQTCQDRTFGS